MKILALESATLAGGAALLDGDHLVGESTQSIALMHSERMMAVVDRLMTDCGWSPKELEGLAVSVGPGSFTGLRIGLSTIKGLAFATGKPAVGVPTLDALASRLPYCAYPICPILDARKNEVYTGLYRTLTGRLEILEAPRAMPPATLAEELRDGPGGPVVLVGDAVGRFGRIFSEILGARACLAPPDLRLPSAVTVGEMATEALGRGETGDPGNLVPLYVRPSEAELARERRQGAGRPN